MNDERWRALCLHLEEGWKGEMSEQRRAVYSTFLKEYDFDVAMRALKALTLRGQPWLPTVPELTAAILEVTTPALPSWSEVWPQIEAVMKANAILAATHGTVAAFIEQEGLGKLRMAPFYDPDKGEMRIHQLRTRFDEFADVRAARERQRVALGTARAAELERAAARALPETAGVGFPE